MGLARSGFAGTLRRETESATSHKYARVYFKLWPEWTSTNFDSFYTELPYSNFLFLPTLRRADDDSPVTVG